MSARVSAGCSWYSEDRHHVYVISKCLLHCHHPQVDPRWQLVRDAENRLRIKRRMRTKNFVKVGSSVLQACRKHQKGYSTCVLSVLLESSTLQHLTEEGACALRKSGTIQSTHQPACAWADSSMRSLESVVLWCRAWISCTVWVRLLSRKATTLTCTWR